MERGHPEGVLIPYLMGPPRGFVCAVRVFTSYRELATVEEGAQPLLCKTRILIEIYLYVFRDIFWDILFYSF